MSSSADGGGGLAGTGKNEVAHDLAKNDLQIESDNKALIVLKYLW